MADCESATPVIPTYAPISTFTGDNYNPLGAQSGIFLGCSNNGIKVGAQSIWILMYFCRLTVNILMHGRGISHTSYFSDRLVAFQILTGHKKMHFLYSLRSRK